MDPGQAYPVPIPSPLRLSQPHAGLEKVAFVAISIQVQAALMWGWGPVALDTSGWLVGAAPEGVSRWDPPV